MLMKKLGCHNNLASERSGSFFLRTKLVRPKDYHPSLHQLSESQLDN